MRRLCIPLTLLGLCGILLPVACAAQSAPDVPQNQNPAPGSAASPGTQPATASTTTPADPKKAKKVWTNDDVHSLDGSVSVVGNAKNLGKPGSAATADGSYIANAKKELKKLRSQLDDTSKELADMKDFLDGKAPAPSGYPISKGYNRVPVDQQVATLEAKKKDLEGKIDALLDEARKKGVQPGDLR